MSRPALKPEIEDLPPEAWQRIEDRVFERLERPESMQVKERSFVERYLWSAFPVAALALAASVFAVVIASRSGPSHELRTQPAAETISAENSKPQQQNVVAVNQPEHHDETQQEPAVAPSAEILSPLEPRIVTTSGTATTKLGASLLSIGSHSDVHFEGDDVAGWLVLVDRGSVHFDVAPRNGRPDFVVRSGDVTVRVIGTRFDVTRNHGSTRVMVQEGVVRVEQAGREVSTLGAGDTWPDVNLSPSRPRTPANATSKGNSTVDARRLAAERDRQDFEQASRLEQTDPAGARARYRKLSETSGPWAANALYAEARLLLDQGRVDAANRLLRRYLARYPSGANAPDVRQLLAKQSTPDPKGSGK